MKQHLNTLFVTTPGAWLFKDGEAVAVRIEKQTNYYWGEDEYSKGAYAIYGKGQWFGLRPILTKPYLHTHFAGEHLADWQGFMEGAINTGEDAAAAIL